MSLEARLQAVNADYQKLQSDLSNAVDARQRLEAQLTENEIVKKEFDQLKPSNEVYKLIGPVLVKQDQAEAKANVDKRLEFIRGEIKRIEAQLKDIGEKSEKKKMEIVEIQTAHQQQLQQS
ncbi:prefoldin subunit 6, partial [Rickenella mellea]